MNRATDSAPITTVNAPLQRWEYYDALGRNTGYRYADGFDPNGNLAHHFHPTRCQYDPEGQPSLPCALDAVWTTHDGPNAAAMITGWRFVSAPGADELLLGRFALSAAYRQTLYFVMDGQGRQLAVGDSSGFLVEADVSTDRGAWQYAGATQNGFTFDVNRQGSGAPGGVSYFRNRAYDSRTGRWKQEDPLGVAGGLNLYQFNGNNPATYTDPFGLCPIPPSSCLGAAGVSLAVGLIPGVGDAVDIIGAVVGKDLITGESISGAARMATVVGTLVGSGRAARQSLQGAADLSKAASRPSNFRKGTLQSAWDNATDGSAGGKLCPTCKKEVKVAPGTGRRDWDGSHNPSWNNRDHTGMSRQEVLNDFNQGVGLECPSCNRSRQDNDP